MSRKRKGKYQPLQNKRKKGKQSSSLAVSRQQTTPGIENAAAAVSMASPEATAVQAPAMVQAPELVAELRRVGVLALVMLSALIVLVLVLG